MLPNILHKCRLSVLPDAPVARGEEEVARLDPARRRVGGTPTSPAATWHRTSGAGAPRGAAWPSRPPPRGGGDTSRAAGCGCASRRASTPAPLALPALRPPNPRQPPLAAPWPGGHLLGRARGLPIPSGLPTPRVTHRASPPRPPFLATMARHGRECVT